MDEENINDGATEEESVGYEREEAAELGQEHKKYQKNTEGGRIKGWIRNKIAKETDNDRREQWRGRRP